MEAYASVNGIPIRSGVLHEPGEGVWFFDGELTDELPPNTSRVTLRIGSASYSGTVDPQRSGAAELRSRLRVIGGANGWRSLLPRRTYSNDAGVPARVVAADAANEAGETLASFASVDGPTLARHFLREAGPASAALALAARSSAWWVARDGLTHVGERAVSVAPVGAYEVLEINPETREALLAVDDLASVGVGSVVVSRSGERLTIRSLDVELSSDSVRCRAWCGDGSRSRIADALLAVVAQAQRGKLWGKYRYRVQAIHGQRVHVQAVRPSVGLPDALAISLAPGVGGFHTKPTLGSECFVEFEAGDPSLPIVTAFVGQDSARHVPDEVAFAEGVRPVAAIGDTVDVFFPAEVPVVGLVGGAPFEGVITILTPASGIINSGTPKLKVP